MKKISYITEIINFCPVQFHGKSERFSCPQKILEFFDGVRIESFSLLKFPFGGILTW